MSAKEAALKSNQQALANQCAHYAKFVARVVETERGTESLKAYPALMEETRKELWGVVKRLPGGLPFDSADEQARFGRGLLKSVRLDLLSPEEVAETLEVVNAISMTLMTRLLTGDPAPRDKPPPQREQAPVKTPSWAGEEPAGASPFDPRFSSLRVEPRSASLSAPVVEVAPALPPAAEPPATNGGAPSSQEGLLLAGLFAGLSPLQNVFCRDCGRKARVFEARDEGWPERDRCNACAGTVVEQPRLTVPRKGVRYTAGVIARGPFEGLYSGQYTTCEGCGRKERVFNAIREKWPNGRRCADCGPESVVEASAAPEAVEPVPPEPVASSVREDLSSPFRGMAPMGQVRCRECGAESLVCLVRREWPEVDYCNRCAEGGYERKLELAGLDAAGKIEMGPLRGFWPSQWVSCATCGERARAFEAKDRWQSPTLCGRCVEAQEHPPAPVNSAPGTAVPEDSLHLPKTGAKRVESGPFRGYWPQQKVQCAGCGKRNHVYNVRYSWPEPVLCRECAGPTKEVPPREKSPWDGVPEDAPVWCGVCEHRSRAHLVRRVWPLPDLCDHCARETEPEGVRCEAHGMASCPICFPVSPALHHCEECGKEIAPPAVRCPDCTVKEVEKAVALYKHAITKVEELVAGEEESPAANGEEVPYFHEKGPNPLSKKRLTGPHGKDQSWRQKRERRTFLRK